MSTNKDDAVNDKPVLMFVNPLDHDPFKNLHTWTKTSCLDYGTWIQKNCLVSRNGFRLLPDLKEEITNEKAYELYLESLKNK